MFITKAGIPKTYKTIESPSVDITMRALRIKKKKKTPRKTLRSQPILYSRHDSTPLRPLYI